MTRNVRKTLLILGGIALIAALVGGELLYFFKKDAPLPDLHHYKALRTLSAALILAEKPDAISVCFADEGTESLREEFGKMGLMLTNSTFSGTCSVVLFSKLPRNWKDLKSRVAANGLLVQLINAKDLKKRDFMGYLNSFPFRSYHLWMPGEYDWLIIGRPKPRKLKVSALFDLFTRENLFDSFAAAGLMEPADIFSSYVGTWEELKDAFDCDLTQTVLPENFVTREVPPIDWLSKVGVEKDILNGFLQEVRSRQVIRREVLKGAIFARHGDEDGALDAWASAWKRNPNDSMLLERLYRLAVNARAFMKVGNLKGAAKCYETMIAIRPTDIPVLKAYADCLLTLGQRPLAQKVLEKAREFEKMKLE